MAAPKNRFLSPERLLRGSRVTLSPEESHHLLHVVRLKEGAEVLLIDGLGGLAEAEVLSANKKGVSVQVKEVQHHPANRKVTLAFGVTKTPALEFILHRVTELGIAAFQPVYTQHSLRLSSWNDERWKKILLETAKQCQELHLPLLHQPVEFGQWLSKRDTSRTLFFCDETHRDLAPTTGEGHSEVLVGPEGGWSEEEISAVVAAGAHRLSLGQNRLRAETSCVVAVALVKRIVGEI